MPRVVFSRFHGCRRTPRIPAFRPCGSLPQFWSLIRDQAPSCVAHPIVVPAITRCAPVDLANLSRLSSEPAAGPVIARPARRAAGAWVGHAVARPGSSPRQYRAQCANRLTGFIWQTPVGGITAREQDIQSRGSSRSLPEACGMARDHPSTRSRQPRATVLRGRWSPSVLPPRHGVGGQHGVQPRAAGWFLPTSFVRKPKVGATGPGSS